MGNVSGYCSANVDSEKQLGKQTAQPRTASGFKQINILEYERLVKQYATRADMGYINIEQLSAAFQGTQIF